VADLDLVLSVALGIGLAAAAGFRVFVPLLIVGAIARAGDLPLGESFAWLATDPALLMLAVAALVEVIAYYIPGLDNLLDAIATPGAILAGVIVSAAVMVDLPPMLKWTLAIIAGGGAAAMTQGTTAALRAHSTMLSAGLGNALLATAELLGAALVSLLAIAAPLAALLVVVIFAALAFRLWRKFRLSWPRFGGPGPNS
jgi:hypothetical protein